MSTSAQRVLVVDDEPQIVRGLQVILRSVGYKVEVAASKREALDAVAVRPPDVVVLDLILPDGNGAEICSEIRSWSSVPIVVLSAIGDEREKVKVLDVGADDYVTKPFNANELLARLRAVLRRRADVSGEPVVAVGDLTIDLVSHRVTVGGEAVHLTPIEFDLLRALATQKGKLVTHRQLLQSVWGAGYESETHYLRVHVAHIRSKLEPDPTRPCYVLTDPGVGYRLADPS